MASSDKINLLYNDTGFYNEIPRCDYEVGKDTSERIELIASHMHKQYQEYLKASINTTRVFEKLLDEIPKFCWCLKNTFEKREMSPAQVFCEIDADRSVGILNILWHSISFTTRGNTKPQALFREENQPLFSGRIIALNGDFQDAALEIQDQEYPDMLRCEIASMYIPHDPYMQAIIKIRHLQDKEFKFDQSDAHRQFLMKIIEVICGGGIYHEVGPETDEDFLLVYNKYI